MNTKARYVVKVERRLMGPTNIDSVDEYLGALDFNPYLKEGQRRFQTYGQDNAFKFRSRTAAEMAAVAIGGRVVRLVKRVKL